MNPTIRSKIIFGIASCAKYLHENSIAYINLNIENIYLNEKIEPKISCNCLGQIIDHCNSIINFCDDIYKYLYIAPELLLDGDLCFVKYIDAYLMFSEEIKFDEKIKNKNKIQFFGAISWGIRPIKPDLMPDCYWELVCSCWNNNPANRPLFDRIVEALKDDKFAINEFGMKTDLNELHKYQQKVSIKIEIGDD